MGNAQAQGLEHLLPLHGGDFDLIVLGLQESTYDVKDKGLKRGASNKNMNKSAVSAAEAAYREASGESGSGSTSGPSVPRQQMKSNKSFINSFRNSLVDSDDQATRAASKERCVEILLDNIETVLGDTFYLVRLFFLMFLLLIVIIN